MIQIKKFIEKISYLESKNSKDVILNIQDARGLRDEISKLLLDLNSFQSKKPVDIAEVTKVEIRGGTFK